MTGHDVRASSLEARPKISRPVPSHRARRGQTPHLELDFNSLLSRRRPLSQRLGRLARRQHLPRRLAGIEGRPSHALPCRCRTRMASGSPSTKTWACPPANRKPSPSPCTSFRSRRKLRIVTSLCIYWDEIFLSETAAPAEAHQQQLRIALRRPPLPRLLRIRNRPSAQTARHIPL